MMSNSTSAATNYLRMVRRMRACWVVILDFILYTENLADPAQGTVSSRSVFHGHYVREKMEQEIWISIK